MNRKKLIIIITIFFLVLGSAFLIFLKRDDLKKKTLFINSISAFSKVAKLLPIKNDTKKELEAIDALTQAITKEDNVKRRYLFLLQNNMELRPGGGFLGQYAVVKIKNGKVTSHFIEDANLLDQRIEAKIKPPYPFKRMMSIKKWKFRDSNFSPDFPANVEKAEYFYHLAGGNSNFDGVVAVNATVLNEILEITGPITLSGTEYNAENAFLKLEEKVEKAYIYNEELDTQNRKWIMKKMGDIIIQRLQKINNIPALAKMILNDLRNKDIMLHFSDKNLQKLAEDTHWAGTVSKDWSGDYLMLVDANMGALKSDYYIKREVEYKVDLTKPKPIATLRINYRHTATQGDWRTSDYHSYLRVYAPEGSNLLERKMVSYPNVQEDLNKTYFGFILHVLINRHTQVEIKYELPEKVKDDYRLLVQKQSGVGNVPIKIKIKTEEGETEQQEILKKDLKFELEK